MEVIKEWFGKQGLLARFYSILDCKSKKYYLDYDMCRQTILVGVDNVPDNIPSRYKKYISRYFNK